MLHPDEPCSEGRNIQSFDECDRAGTSLGIEKVALKNNKQNCYATESNFDDGSRREMCKKGGETEPAGDYWHPCSY